MLYSLHFVTFPQDQRLLKQKKNKKKKRSNFFNTSISISFSTSMRCCSRITSQHFSQLEFSRSEPCGPELLSTGHVIPSNPAGFFVVTLVLIGVKISDSCQTCTALGSVAGSETVLGLFVARRDSGVSPASKINT